MNGALERSALVMHSAERMFELVNDVSSYPESCLWCAGAEVHRAEPSQLVSWILKGAVRQRFTTCNRFMSPERFPELVGWPVYNAFRWLDIFSNRRYASKVSLSLQFEFNGLLSRLAFGRFFLRLPIPWWMLLRRANEALRQQCSHLRVTAL